VEQGLEGVVAKRLGSAYRPGARSRDWLKTAHRRILDCVICGLTAGAVPVSAAGQAFSFGSLVLGCWTEAGGRGPEPSAGGLAYLGNVGTGWDQAGLGRLLAQVRPRASSPFAPGRGPPRRVARETLWLEPLLVAEVAYREVTPDGVLRHPSFIGLREDKAPRECGPPPGRGGG
jgi:bifunctional non-homologous end joining protein LigD